MQADQISRTALFTAYSRGFHYSYDQPVIFADPLAYSLLPQEEQNRIAMLLMAGFRMTNPVAADAFSDTQAALGWLMQSSAAASIVLSRARYAEDCLEQSIASGVSQYVILGAGLDSFAYRRPDLIAKLQLFEVDHPATQGYKRQRLTELGWQPPESLYYVPVDFNHQKLWNRLAASPFNPDRPAFFSLLGVAYYLPREVILDTLAELARLAPAGSSIVFDYLDKEAFVPGKCAPRVRRMLDHVASLGEPMLTGFEPLTLAEQLAPLGLGLQEQLSPWDIHNRWFLGRSDHYRACEHIHFAWAVL